MTKSFNVWAIHNKHDTGGLLSAQTPTELVDAVRNFSQWAPKGSKLLIEVVEE